MLNTRIGRLTILLFLISVGLVSSSVKLPESWIATAQDATYEEELENGKAFFRQRRYEEALKLFKHANELREKKCAECYGWLSETYLALEAYKNVLDSAVKVMHFAVMVGMLACFRGSAAFVRAVGAASAFGSALIPAYVLGTGKT